MDDLIPESNIKTSIDPIDIKGTEIILYQLKNCVCKIKIGEKLGTGFFLIIPYNNTNIRVLMTNHHVIDENFLNKYPEIKLSINDGNDIKTINIDKDRKFYSSEKYDTTIIALKKEDRINNYLELDEIFSVKDLGDKYEDKSIYVLHYPQGEKAYVSYSFLKKIKDFNISHKCSTDKGSSGSPILNLKDYKVVGIHLGGHKSEKFNVGTFLQEPISEFLENIHNDSKIKNSLIKNITDITFKEKKNSNKIKLTIRVDKNDLKEKFFSKNTNKIYFLDNSKEHNHLKELNNENVQLYINDTKKEFNKYFIPEKEGIYEIKLKFDILVKDCSYMFYNCNNIININLSSFDSSKVTNMKNMFGYCYSIENLNLSSFDTSKVTNMEKMFDNCWNLDSVNLSSFNTSEVENMEKMFNNCFILKKINFSSFNINKVKNVCGMFYNCMNLNYLDLSFSNLEKMIKMKCKNNEDNNINDNNIKKQKRNEIELFIYVTQDDLNNKNKIYFLNKTSNEINESNVQININGKNIKFEKYWIPEKKGIYNIKLKFNNIIKDASYMFDGCKRIIYINLLSFNTSNATNMEGMFTYCGLRNIDLSSSFNVSKVTNMENMFSGCENIGYLDLSSFDTSNVTNMRDMFFRCYNLKSLNLSSFDTSKVTNMENMFYECTKLESLNLSSFNTSNVTNMGGMFYGCYNLIDINLSSFKTSNVTNMEGMFHKCYNLKNINLSSFETSKVINMKEMFAGCKLTCLNLSNIVTSNVTNMEGMLSYCDLKNIDLSSFVTSKVISMKEMFAGCDLTCLDLSSFDTSKVTNMENMFYGCTKLESLNLSSFNTSNVTNMEGMFYKCSNLKNLDLSSFNTSKVTQMGYMFYNCNNIESFNLSSFDTSKVTDLEYIMKEKGHLNLRCILI